MIPEWKSTHKPWAQLTIAPKQNNKSNTDQCSYPQTCDWGCGLLNESTLHNTRLHRFGRHLLNTNVFLGGGWFLGHAWQCRASYSWLYSQKSFVEVWESIWNTGSQTQVGHRQDKRPIHCTIFSAPISVSSSCTTVHACSHEQGLEQVIHWDWTWQYVNVVSWAYAVFDQRKERLLLK